MDAAAVWDELAKPWRAVAEGCGFRPLDGKVDKVAGGYRCLDFLLSGATYLDLEGAVDAGTGSTHGFWTATLTTWVDGPGGRFSLTTIGAKEPRPRPGGGLGWLLGEVIGPLLQRMVPAGARPLPLRAPEDLRRLIDKHLAELLAMGGKPVKFEGDALEMRLEQARRDERQGAPDPKDRH
jgi:hypothetical protein